VPWSVQPEPADENEREALLAALDRALAEEEGAASGWLSAWWRSGLDDLEGLAERRSSWGRDDRSEART
jgi:hypothetical protein